MNFTKEDVARQILKHVNYYLHFAEVGTDADPAELRGLSCTRRSRSKGFETTIDLDQAASPSW